MLAYEDSFKGITSNAKGEVTGNKRKRRGARNRFENAKS